MGHVEIIFNQAEFQALVHNPEIADLCERDANEIIREVRSRIHNHTGRTSRSIAVERVSTEEGPAADVRMMWYYRFVDQGTVHIRARHTIEDAIDAVANRL